MKPLTHRELLKLCALLRRYTAEVRYHHGHKAADKVRDVLGDLEDHLTTMYEVPFERHNKSKVTP